MMSETLVRGARPGHRRDCRCGCRDDRWPSTMDSLLGWYAGRLRRYADSVETLLASLPELPELPGLLEPWRPGRFGQRRGRERAGPCNCGRHGAGRREWTDRSCHHEWHHDGCDRCSCCPADADVVVRARLGERRVVPVTVVNEWRRERTVTLGLGDWAGCPGDPTVRVEGELSPSGEVRLGPCERLQVVAAVTATLAEGESGRPASGAGGDVSACATFCADLRIDGCARPVRLALHLLPRSCGTLEVCCDCGCCDCG